MTLKLKDIIYSAWVIIASEEEIRVLVTNFRNAVTKCELVDHQRILLNFRDAVLAFQEEESK